MRSTLPADPVRPTLPARDLAEIRVAEQLTAAGCPLCGWRAASERRQIDALIADAITDPGVRRRIEAAGGWCPHHTALLPIRERERRGGTLGSAIVLGAVLASRLETVETAVAAGGRRLRERIGAARNPADCPVCADTADSVSSMVAIVIGRLADPAWSAALAPANLCLSDLLLLWELCARAGGRTLDAWRPIGDAQLGRLRDLVATADAYIAHSAHDRQGELTEDERLAADAVVRALAGDPVHPADRASRAR